VLCDVISEIRVWIRPAVKPQAKSEFRYLGEFYEEAICGWELEDEH
jgi:hypothetical protein